MRYSKIDRFSESHEATLANITAILYDSLGCTKDASYDYILDKLREIEEFDLGDTIENAEWKLDNGLDNGYAYLWKAQHGLIKEDL